MRALKMAKLNRAEYPTGKAYSLKEAQVVIEKWRVDFNTKGLHKALGHRPPAPRPVALGSKFVFAVHDYDI